MQALTAPDSDPFPFLIVDDFLPSELLSRTEGILAAGGSKETHPAGYTFEAFFEEKLIRFLFSFVRKTAGPHFGVKYGFSPVYKLPQIYRIKGPWKGLAPHTDNQPGRDLAMIIYLSRGWRPEFGGELQLLDSNGRSWQTVEPVFNRAVFFPLGNSSWHAVRPLNEGFERVTLIQDWAVT